MLACPALQTSSIISARRMVSKIVAPKSRRLGMRRVLMPFFGGRFFGSSNGGGCRASDGRPSSGTAGAADEREQHQYQPDRERENRRLAAHSHYHCPHYRFHHARVPAIGGVLPSLFGNLGRAATDRLVVACIPRHCAARLVLRGEGPRWFGL